MLCGCNPQYIGPSLAATCSGTQYLLFMSLLDSLFRNSCPISEICERVKPVNEPSEEYDFVVIGGGTSGSVVASRLSEVPEWRVLLLEAGGDEPPAAEVPMFYESFLGPNAIDWGYKTEPEKEACLGNEERRCVWPRGKVLGGCNVLNGMLYSRGVPRDYQVWTEMGNEGWSYEEVLPYYKKSEDNLEIGSLVEERFHGRGGYLTTSTFRDLPEVTDALFAGVQELGYPVVKDFNADEEVGFAVLQANSRDGVRLTTARAFLRDDSVRKRPNLDITLNATATKINIETNEGSKRATSVEFIHKNATKKVRITKEVILAAGALNSPQLLLLSGVGPKTTLEDVGIEQVHELEGVGKNLFNHVSIRLTFDMLKQKYVNDLNWKNIKRYLKNRNGPLSSTGLAQVSGRVYSGLTDSNSEPPDLQFIFHGYTTKCSATGSSSEGSNETDYRQISFAPVHLHPKSRGHLTLKSNNPLDPPLMYANYFEAAEDVETLLASVRISQALANTSVLREGYELRLVMDDYEVCEGLGFDSDDYWRCVIKYWTAPENHQAGTCKMGPKTDALAVVDATLGVYGVSGLRVADASVFPTTVSGNNNAIIVMIAERCADFVKEFWS